MQLHPSYVVSGEPLLNDSSINLLVSEDSQNIMRKTECKSFSKDTDDEDYTLRTKLASGSSLNASSTFSAVSFT